MTLCFENLFRKSSGSPVKYKDKTLYLFDKFSISDEDILLISIENTNSQFTQGLALTIEGECEIKGKRYKKNRYTKVLFWEDSTILDPKNIEVKVFTKKNYINIQNIWEQVDYAGNKTTQKAHNGAAMIVEEIDNGKRYRCNDGTPDEDFDDIIFTVQRLKNEKLYRY